MARFYVEETWREAGVDVVLHCIEPLAPGDAAHLVERGMLGSDDDQAARVKIGEFTVDYPGGAFPKKVRRAALDWLAAHAGCTDADSVEIQIATDGVLELLQRIEAAVAR